MNPDTIPVSVEDLPNLPPAQFWWTIVFLSAFTAFFWLLGRPAEDD